MSAPRRRTDSLVAPIAAVVTFALALHAADAAAAGDRARRHVQDGEAAVTLSKSAAGQSESKTKTGNPTHVVNEGGVDRPLWIDTSRVVEFPEAGGAGRPALRAAEPGELSEGSRAGKAGDRAAPAAAGAPRVSPVFVDTSGQPRALPGGVIVSLKQGLPAKQAKDQLLGAGLTPLRQIGERMWLVESPVGIASLDLANRLGTSGDFEFVQPNWWQPRTTK